MSHNLSVIVPFYNESETARFVLDELKSVLPDAEIIVVDDGSRDDTWTIIQSVTGIRAHRFTENRGQSAAMYAGLRLATRDFCGLMDGDGQNDPADFPSLLKLAQPNTLICGYRAQRKDTGSRRIASKIANWIRRRFIHDGVRDTGCSLKVFPREAVDHLVAFNGMHRYIPAMMKQAGMNIEETPVNHRGRYAGNSKYTNFERALRGLYDLVGVSWLLKRKVRFDVAPSIASTDAPTENAR